jgi:hypothetical protein
MQVKLPNELRASSFSADISRTITSLKTVYFYRFHMTTLISNAQKASEQTPTRELSPPHLPQAPSLFRRGSGTLFSLDAQNTELQASIEKNPEKSTPLQRPRWIDRTRLCWPGQTLYRNTVEAGSFTRHQILQDFPGLQVSPTNK